MIIERSRIIKALCEFDAPAGIDDIVAKSGLSRGKVLGNLPRLVIDGLVDKSGRHYIPTKKGRAIIARHESVSENKGFHFYFKENVPSGLVARSLQGFYEIIEEIDVSSLEYHIQRGDFENWIRDVLHDEELASNIAKLKREEVPREALRERLYRLVERRFEISENVIT